MKIFRRGDRSYDCHEIVRLLQGYLDGEVEENEARKVAGHLSGCSICGLEAKALSDIKEALNRLGEPVDPAIVERLKQYLREISSD